MRRGEPGLMENLPIELSPNEVELLHLWGQTGRWHPGLSVEV